jgi:hypothetical protein
MTRFPLVAALAAPVILMLAPFGARAQVPCPGPVYAVPVPAQPVQPFVGNSYSFWAPDRSAGYFPYSSYYPGYSDYYPAPAVYSYSSYYAPSYAPPAAAGSMYYRPRYANPGPYYYTPTYSYTPGYYSYYYTPGYFRY